MSRPRISRARASASAGVSASLMPPAFPRPPVSTCALTTTGSRAPALPPRLRRGRGQPTLGHRDAVAPEELFPLVLVRVQARECTGSSVRGMGPMGRSTAIVFVVLGAALAGLAFSSAAGRFQRHAPAAPSIAAGPQNAELNWRETYGRPGEQLVFEVERLQVLASGWRVSLALTNGTSVAYGWATRGPPRSGVRADAVPVGRHGRARTPERQRHASGRAWRCAEPSLPEVLEPRILARMSAPGALVSRKLGQGRLSGRCSPSCDRRRTGRGRLDHGSRHNCSPEARTTDCRT
jgi:hypothetical protein